jgi:hypothetical protein
MLRKPVLRFAGVALFSVAATLIFQEGELQAAWSARRPLEFCRVSDSTTLTQTSSGQLARGYGWKRARKKVVV